MAKGYQRRKRASKYEKKLAINASFEDVIKIALGMEIDPVLHFCKAENKIQYEFKNISAIAFTEIKVFKGDFDEIDLNVYFEYTDGTKNKCHITLVIAAMLPPTESNPTLPLIPSYASDNSRQLKSGSLSKLILKCENKEEDDFDFKIRYIIQ